MTTLHTYLWDVRIRLWWNGFAYRSVHFLMFCLFVQQWTWKLWRRKSQRKRTTMYQVRMLDTCWPTVTQSFFCYSCLGCSESVTMGSEYAGRPPCSFSPLFTILQISWRTLTKPQRMKQTDSLLPIPPPRSAVFCFVFVFKPLLDSQGGHFLLWNC